LWLDQLGADLRIRGWKRLTSRVQYDDLDSPSAILTRSNAGCIAGAIRGLADGKRVAITGGGHEIEKLANAADDLMQGRKTSHEDLMAFDDWESVQRYVKEESEDAGSL